MHRDWRMIITFVLTMSFHYTLNLLNFFANLDNSIDIWCNAWQCFATKSTYTNFSQINLHTVSIFSCRNICGLSYFTVCSISIWFENGRYKIFWRSHTGKELSFSETLQLSNVYHVQFSFFVHCIYCLDAVSPIY